MQKVDLKLYNIYILDIDIRRTPYLKETQNISYKVEFSPHLLDELMDLPLD